MNMNDLNFKLLENALTEDELFIETAACLNCPKPSCVLGCPIGNRIPEFIKAAKEKDYSKAFEIISEKSMLPAICGAVCPHEKQCQGSCVKNKIGKPVNIGKIERFIGEWAIENGLDKKYQKKEKNGKRVLIVGSGPAGLSASYHLIRNGYSVSVIEKNDYLGGVLKHGIPSFRFNYGVVEKIIDNLKSLGVEFKTSISFGKDITLEEAKKKYSFIFLGTGTDTPNKMNIEGIDLDGVLYANSFLKDVNLAECDENFKKKYDKYLGHVVVVGGGNVAMDAARCAIRLDTTKDVTIVYRRTENEMPASKSELEDAKREGIKFLPLTNPVKLIGNARLESVECAVMELSSPDESGRRKPVESNKPHIFIEADTIIFALGYSNDKQIDDIRVGKWNNILIDEGGMTSIENVYAGGDNVTGSLTVVSAMNAGLTAAKSIIEKETQK